MNLHRALRTTQAAYIRGRWWVVMPLSWACIAVAWIAGIGWLAMLGGGG